jgi:hypothetical protein
MSMGEIVQFPLKQTTLTQVVGANGDMYYVYIVDYQMNGEVASLHLWAKDDDDAAERLYHLTITGMLRGRLSQYVEQQNVGKKKLVDPDDPSGGA